MIIAVISAVWFGILTSISPCPLATNIAAISYISRNLDNTFLVLGSGIAYTIGRVLAYTVVAVIVVSGLLSIPTIANFLQKYLNIILGPLLIITGMFLLEMLHLNVKLGSITDRMSGIAQRGSLPGAALLGIVFGLSFCPVSAALFFGSLIPLAVTHNSRIILPSIYGVGTALPVVFFSIILAFSLQSLGRIFDVLKAFEIWARRITGVLFILVGIYLTILHAFKFNIGF